MEIDREKYPNLHWVLFACGQRLRTERQHEARAELERLITERVQAALREPIAITQAMLEKVTGALVDATALCKALGLEVQEDEEDHGT